MRAKPARWFPPLVVAIFLFMLFVSARIFLRQQEELQRVNRRAVEVQQQYQVVEQDRKNIEGKRVELGSPQEIEEVARNELGMVKPGEILFEDAQ